METTNTYKTRYPEYTQKELILIIKEKDFLMESVNIYILAKQKQDLF